MSRDILFDFRGYVISTLCVCVCVFFYKKEKKEMVPLSPILFILFCLKVSYPTRGMDCILVLVRFFSL